MSGSCNQGTGRKSKSRGNNLRSLPMCCLGVAWVRRIAQGRICRTLPPRPDSLSIRSHTREVEALTLSERYFSAQHMPGVNPHTPGKDALLIFAVSSYNIYQNYTCIYHTMCCKQGKPSVPVHLTLMPSSSVGRNSDPFLGFPVPLLVLLEHSTSAWRQVLTQEFATKKLLWDTMSSE